MSAMITIHHLDVRFDVEGDGDEAVFARLFEKYIARWSRLHEEAESRRRLTERERALCQDHGGGAR